MFFLHQHSHGVKVGKVVCSLASSSEGCLFYSSQSLNPNDSNSRERVGFVANIFLLADLQEEDRLFILS